MAPWAVPAELAARMVAPDQQRWVAALPAVASELASRWRLQATGRAWSGWWSAVWPVLDDAGRPLALKITTDGDGREHEAAALRVWDGHGAVGLVDHEPEQAALLLERLDGDRTLSDHRPIDDATSIIADLLADLGGRPPFAGLRTPEEIGASMTDDIERDTDTGLVPPPLVSRARATLTWFRKLPPSQWTLVHGDCHFANVLPTLPGQPARWAAIDPLPFAGIPEIEPVAMLRNRFDDALATGDPERALRRRVDMIADRTGMDAALVRRFSQAVAVQNLPFLLAEAPRHQFVAPYEIIATW